MGFIRIHGLLGVVRLNLHGIIHLAWHSWVNSVNRIRVIHTWIRGLIMFRQCAVTARRYLTMAPPRPNGDSVT